MRWPRPNAVMVPLQCEFFALEGLSQLLKTIERVRANLNPPLEIQGIVLTMFDKRNKLSDQVAADVRAHMGDKVYKTVIPRNVRISEAPSHGLAGAGLRSALPRQPGLYQARRRNDPARKAEGRRMSSRSRMSRHRGLGRGLSALIGDEAAPARGEPAARRAHRACRVSAAQPLSAAQDVQRGRAATISPIPSRKKACCSRSWCGPSRVSPTAFEIVAGERRWRAAQMAKLHDVPVVVRESADGESLELAIIENVQRADLNAVEEAAAYRELMEQFAYTQDDVAQQVGKSRSHVANTLRLLKLPGDSPER